MADDPDTQTRLLALEVKCETLFALHRATSARLTAQHNSGVKADARLTRILRAVFRVLQLELGPEALEPPLEPKDESDGGRPAG